MTHAVWTTDAAPLVLDGTDLSLFQLQSMAMTLWYVFTLYTLRGVWGFLFKIAYMLLHKFNTFTNKHSKTVRPTVC